MGHRYSRACLCRQLCGIEDSRHMSKDQSRYRRGRTKPNTGRSQTGHHQLGKERAGWCKYQTIVRPHAHTFSIPTPHNQRTSSPAAMWAAAETRPPSCTEMLTLKRAGLSGCWHAMKSRRGACVTTSNTRDSPDLAWASECRGTAKPRVRDIDTHGYGYLLCGLKMVMHAKEQVRVFKARATLPTRRGGMLVGSSSETACEKRHTACVRREHHQVREVLLKEG